MSGLESVEPGGFLAGPSTSYRSILDFATSSTVRPTACTSFPSPAAEKSSTEVHVDARDDGLAGCLSSVVDDSVSTKLRSKQAGDDDRLVKCKTNSLRNSGNSIDFTLSIDFFVICLVTNCLHCKHPQYLTD